MTTYRCSICLAIVAQDPDEDYAVCNGTSQCGVLFDSERIVTTKPRAIANLDARHLRFRLAHIPEGGYAEGDDRSYDVLYRGVGIGLVQSDWILSARVGGSARGFHYVGFDRRSGTGATRAAAVLAAQP